MQPPTATSTRLAPPAPPGVTGAPDPTRGSWMTRAVRAVVGVAVCAGLFAGYLRLARTVPVNADGAGLATQAFQMLHGNLLLRGWTVSDVSFYSTELVQYALVELVHGYRPDALAVAAAMTYTLLVVLAAALARGRATGREAVARVALAVALMLLPGPGSGSVIVLGSADHFGTAVPLLFTWLILDRAADQGPGRGLAQGPDRGARRGRWLPIAVAVLLAWGQVGDPLVLYAGALPLMLVGALRLVRAGRQGVARSDLLRAPDARLLVAGLASVLLAQLALLAHRLAGGFHTHSPPVQLSPVRDWGEHLWLAARSLALVCGGYFPELSGPIGVTVGVVEIGGVLLVVGAVGVAAVRAVRGLLRPGAAGPAGGTDGTGGVRGDRVAELLAAGILVNLGAFVVSTLPVDLMSARQISAVLPLGAALAGRVCGRWLLGRGRPGDRSSADGPAGARSGPSGSRSGPAGWGLVPVLAAVLVLFGAVFVARARQHPVPATNADIAAWLQEQGLTRGLGGYWNAATITLASQGRVRVAPVTGADRIMGYRWESRADWYDPARTDARFLVLDRRTAVYGTVATAVAQFGPPARRHDFGDFTVLVYDRNLLVGLPAYCLPHVAPRMADC